MIKFFFGGNGKHNGELLILNVYCDIDLEYQTQLTPWKMIKVLRRTLFSEDEIAKMIIWLYVYPIEILNLN